MLLLAYEILYVIKQIFILSTLFIQYIYSRIIAIIVTNKFYIENPAWKRLFYLVYVLDAHTSTTHRSSNKNIHHGVCDVTLHIQ